MRYDVRCERCGQASEVDKPMRAVMPPCPDCGGALRRVYSAAPAVHYAAGGFYSTDVGRLERQVGRERAAKFHAERADIETRAKAGRLTAYERSLESPALPNPARSG